MKHNPSIELRAGVRPQWSCCRCRRDRVCASMIVSCTARAGKSSNSQRDAQRAGTHQPHEIHVRQNATKHGLEPSTDQVESSTAASACGPGPTTDAGIEPVVPQSGARCGTCATRGAAAPPTSFQSSSLDDEHASLPDPSMNDTTQHLDCHEILR